MGCCTTRMKIDEHSQENDWHIVNTLPTFENVFQTYNELHLPAFSFNQITHRKEQMVFMIVNMIRHRPQIFTHSLTILQERCSQRQTPHNLSFRVEDVGYAIEMLNSMQSKQPLLLADDLCEYSRNLLHQTDLTEPKNGDDVPEGPGQNSSNPLEKNPQGGSGSN